MSDIQPGRQTRSTMNPSPLRRPTADGTPLRPDPGAHAEILVLSYGLQMASWIAETNQTTARRADAPYWSAVRQTIERLRERRPAA